jgi:hypothetical protein
VTAVVDHSRDHYLTVAGTQAACGWALHLLLTEKHRVTGEPLPLLSWGIRDDMPRLYGTTYAGSSEERTAVVAAWAAHLGATPTSTGLALCPRIEFQAVAHGIEVHIQTYLDRQPEESAT